MAVEMNQVNLVGMAERDIFRAERGRIAEPAFIEEALEAGEIDGGRRAGFFLCRGTHRGVLFSQTRLAVKCPIFRGEARTCTTTGSERGG
jgi:hypothetical protein